MKSTDNKNLKHEVSCGAYVIDNDKVLVIQHNQGHWDFPKGHMEKGETEKETAKREVLEETGIEIEIISDEKYIVEYMPNVHVQKKVIFFEAKKIGGKVKKQESEVQKVEWLDIEKVLERITFENSRKSFEEFMKQNGFSKNKI